MYNEKNREVLFQQKINQIRTTDMFASTIKLASIVKPQSSYHRIHTRISACITQTPKHYTIITYKLEPNRTGSSYTLQSVNKMFLSSLTLCIQNKEHI